MTNMQYYLYYTVQYTTVRQNHFGNVDLEHKFGSLKYVYCYSSRVVTTHNVQYRGGMMQYFFSKKFLPVSQDLLFVLRV